MAAENAVFCIAEVRWELIASIIIPQLNDAIGVRQVRRYALTAERFDAQEARRIGLVHEIVPLTELETAASRVVDQLLANGPDAVAQTKSVAIGSAYAKEKGLRRVYGDVLAENASMLQMAAELGFRAEDIGSGLTRVVLDLLGVRHA